MRLAVLALALLGCPQDTPQTTPSSAATSKPKPTASARPDAGGPRFYMGRQLAPTMGHGGAPWLVRPEREAEEKTSLLIDELALSPGDTACDLGAGNGYHSLLMSQRVGEEGRVIAVDIQPEMLKLLEARAKEAGVTNIETVLGTTTDPKLEKGACDLVLMVDVYHELSDPTAMLVHLSRALSEKGRIALVEFREEDPKVPIKPLHKMSKAQMVREMTANGFAVASAFDGLPWQHLMFFQRK